MLQKQNRCRGFSSHRLHKISIFPFSLTHCGYNVLCILFSHSTSETWGKIQLFITRERERERNLSAAAKVHTSVKCFKEPKKRRNEREREDEEEREATARAKTGFEYCLKVARAQLVQWFSLLFSYKYFLWLAQSITFAQLNIKRKVRQKSPSILHNKVSLTQEIHFSTMISAESAAKIAAIYQNMTNFVIEMRLRSVLFVIFVVYALAFVISHYLRKQSQRHHHESRILKRRGVLVSLEERLFCRRLKERVA
jgi:hypothetical protein